MVTVVDATYVVVTLSVDDAQLPSVDQEPAAPEAGHCARVREGVRARRMAEKDVVKRIFVYCVKARVWWWWRGSGFDVW